MLSLLSYWFICWKKYKYKEKIFSWKLTAAGKFECNEEIIFDKFEMNVAYKCTLHTYEFRSCNCKFIVCTFWTYLFFFVIRAKVCFFRFFLWFNQNKITTTRTKHNPEKKLTYETAVTKGKSHRQSSSLNGLNLITALFCIIFVEWTCVRAFMCTQHNGA